MKKVIICTTCPNGCEIAAEYTSKDDFRIEGQRCKRGYEYSFNECFDPKRTFTASVTIKGAERRMLPVRSSAPVPKDKMTEIAGEVKKITVDAPVFSKQIIIKDVLGTGADLIASMTIDKVQEAAK